jgi:hypothetical protein
MTETKPVKDDDKHREAQQKVIEEKRFDFIEKSKPEDRIDGDIDQRAGRGQLTRDNVNPAIPSAKPGEGGIVDPKSLGMESQAGEAPPKAEEPPTTKPIDPDQPDPASPRIMSINEPPGSNVLSKSVSDISGQPPLTPGHLPGQPPETRRAAQPEMPKVSRDPDDIEEELDAEIDDGDIEQKSKKKKK